MHFTQIKLHNFRNYKSQTVFFHPKINIIKGNNAQGKTNLLESLYIMSLGKSFRTNKDSEMIGFQGDFSRVESSYVKSGLERNIEIIFTKKGKSLVIDGYKAKKASEILDNVYIVAFSPEDMKIVKDEPEKRRRFIDRELSQLRPIYYKNLQRYKKALMQRNALLKQDNFDLDLMEIWESSLADYGSRIIKEREEFISNIKNISRQIHKDITNGREELQLFYEASVPYNKSISQTGEILAERLKKERKRDSYRRTTGTGPHRDDIKIMIDDIDVRNFGSQGQQRTSALSLKLAEIKIIENEKAELPILLLDDVLSELDEERQQFLLKAFPDIQLFITTAEAKDSLWNNIHDKYVFDVINGSCERIS